MKKELVITAVMLSMTLMVACGSASNASEHNGTETEATHEHAYVETITTEATCETDGEATYTCECGDTYTEVIAATGHVFENYTSNNDATYLADGTETAKCNGCELTDTRTAEGSMLTYTYTDMDVTMYVQKKVNVRSMPSSDGEKLGGLSTNDEVKVTGQCNETNWYRIEFDGNVAYVNDGYLGNDKVVVQTEETTPPVTNTEITTLSFEPYKVYDEGGLNVYYYMNIDNDLSAERARCDSELHAILSARYPGKHRTSNWAYENFTVNGVRYQKRWFTAIYDANGNVIASMQ